MARAMISIYCDGCFDLEYKICAWGCVIKYKDKTYNHCDYRFMDEKENPGEIWAIVKALGKAKNFKSKNFTIYTDSDDVISKFKRITEQQDVRRAIRYLNVDVMSKALYSDFMDYYKVFNIQIERIPRSENIAYGVARQAILKAREIAEAKSGNIKNTTDNEADTDVNNSVEEEQNS